MKLKIDLPEDRHPNQKVAILSSAQFFISDATAVLNDEGPPATEVQENVDSV
jgi:hypothetical protein